ncbi:MAG: hypothetical protein NVS2B5_17690 [Beijerinckiaceae bacterium]
MQVLRAPFSKSEAQGEATFGMANLRRKTTGLPFIVFISQKDEARHAVRIKLSPEPRGRPDEMSSYLILPFEWKEGPRLSGSDEKLLGRWIDATSRVHLDYWNGEIQYTGDAVDQLKSV